MTMEHRTLVQRMAAAEEHIDVLGKRLAELEKMVKAKPKAEPKAAE